MKLRWPAIWILSISTVLSVAAADPYDPVADEKATVVSGNARFTVLTPELIRAEWSPDGQFEDRASHVFVNRRLPVPNCSVERADGWLTLRTDKLAVRYKEDGGRFAPDNLSITLTLDGLPVRWKPGTQDKGNLRGTYRTLDGVSGGHPIPPGIVSRDGWVLVDDSNRLLFDKFEGTDWPWVVVRDAKDAIDWYFFGYGRDYARAVHDYTRVAGRIPLPPRYAFGAWWSRYWAYSDEELRQLVKDFQGHDVPLDVLVVDMDWHLDGWTGYTWNPKYFPDPEGFLRWVKEQGLKVTLNLHPASGVGKHEAAFRQVAEHMGLDPDAVDNVPFDCTDPRYVEAYFKYLHHPLERQGVDFWWIDWQQGTSVKEGKVPQVDPLFWLNYLHWTDMERNPERDVKVADGVTRRLRPMMFSRWGELGSHRYQIGFSGDTYCNWESLAFQPYFTSTAANVAYPFWSHDIGGHMPGPVEPELYTRWVQWGIVNPVLRTHTTKNPQAERRIWEFPRENFRIMKDAFKLRYSLIPYIYSSARQCYDAAMPLCRPLYYEWPNMDQAYRAGDTYLFGDQMFIAPALAPANPVNGCTSMRFWLPPGEWTHWFTGATHEGPTSLVLATPLDQIPIFVRSGGVIPAQSEMPRAQARAVDPLILHVWPGKAGRTRVYEDDGLTVGYQQGECAWTPVAHEKTENRRQITIGPVEGEFPGMLKQRQYEIRLRDVWPAQAVTLNGEPLQPAAADDQPGWRYDPETFSVVIRLPSRAVTEKATVAVEWDPTTGESGPPLRAGLRGTLDALQAIRDMMGPTAEKLVSSPERVRREIAAGLADADRIAAEVRSVWDETLLCFGTENLEPATATRLAGRLLGLTVDVRAAAAGGDEVNLSVDVGLSPLVGGAGDAAVRLSLDAGPGWSITGTHEWDLAGFAPGVNVARQTRVAADGWPQTGLLTTDVAVKVGEVDVRVPVKKALLPGIGRWWIVGPFPGEFHAPSMDIVFEPERSVDLSATYEGKDGKTVAWRKVERVIAAGADLTEEFTVDFVEQLGKVDHAVAYAFTHLNCPRDMEVTLAIGSDDGVAVWVNGQEVHRHHVARPYSPKQDSVPVKLKKGMNTLLVKVNQWGSGWKLGVHVETPDGKPVPEVTAHLGP